MTATQRLVMLCPSRVLRTVLSCIAIEQPPTNLRLSVLPGRISTRSPVTVSPSLSPALSVPITDMRDKTNIRLESVAWSSVPFPPPFPVPSSLFRSPHAKATPVHGCMKNTRLPNPLRKERELVAGLATLLLDDGGELLDLALGAEEGAELGV